MKFEIGDIVSLVCGKVRMVVSSRGHPFNESLDSVNVHWEENGYVRTAFINTKCLRLAPEEILEEQKQPESKSG